ncbi:MAG: hypothetical protein FWH51_00260, partial [Dehalococcoidia bacterium]|nr:hypothetical protein [Dehalococcoidia bacterium]
LLIFRGKNPSPSGDALPDPGPSRIYSRKACKTQVYNTPISKDIEITLTGVQFRMNGDPDDDRIIEIAIKGEFRRYLFGNQSSDYRGRFSIEGYDYTDYGHNAWIAWLPPNPASPLVFLSGETIKHLGWIICTTSLDTLIISVYEGHNTDIWNQDHGLIICAPANNRADAMVIIENLNPLDNGWWHRS